MLYYFQFAINLSRFTAQKKQTFLAWKGHPNCTLFWIWILARTRSFDSSLKPVSFKRRCQVELFLSAFWQNAFLLRKGLQPKARCTVWVVLQLELGFSQVVLSKAVRRPTQTNVESAYRFSSNQIYGLFNAFNDGKRADSKYLTSFWKVFKFHQSLRRSQWTTQLFL